VCACMCVCFSIGAGVLVHACSLTLKEETGILQKLFVLLNFFYVITFEIIFLGTDVVNFQFAYQRCYGTWL
jgi:hypothetical protein